MTLHVYYTRLDNLLSLQWYDAQGCIQSDAIDVMEETPLFVTLIMVLQRLDRMMWGISQGALKVVEHGVGSSAELNTECRGRFELVGRRSYCASVTKSEEDTAATTSFFLKSRWAEERQEYKEPDIIRIAHDRASKLLPKEYRDMITMHIPDVVASGECTTESTMRIRLLMKKAGGLEDMCIDCIYQYARVQVVLVTKKLQPVDDLSPIEFWRVFWDIIRCKPASNSNRA